MSRTVVLTIYRGLPGSGKTVDARTRQVERPLGDVVRVNRDDLRAMLFSKSYRGTPIPEIENVVTRVQHDMIRTLLELGVDVLCDDTNLNPEFLPLLHEVAHRAGAEIQVVDLTGVDYWECIMRDRRRSDEHYVGGDVIEDMWRRYLKPKPTDA